MTTPASLARAAAAMRSATSVSDKASDAVALSRSSAAVPASVVKYEICKGPGSESNCEKDSHERNVSAAAVNTYLTQKTLTWSFGCLVRGAQKERAQVGRLHRRDERLRL